MTVVAATGASQRTRAVRPDHQRSRPRPRPNQPPTCARRRSPTCCRSHPRRSPAGRRRASCPCSRRSRPPPLPGGEDPRAGGHAPRGAHGLAPTSAALVAQQARARRAGRERRPVRSSLAPARSGTPVAARRPAGGPSGAGAPGTARQGPAAIQALPDTGSHRCPPGLPSAALRHPPIAGRATFTTLMSRMTMNWATQSRTRACQRLGSAGRGGGRVVRVRRGSPAAS
jgi:hypothetical protein